MERIEYLLTGASGFLGKVILSGLSPRYSVKTLGKSIGNDYTVDIRKPFTIPSSFQTIIHASGKAHMIPSNKIEAADFFSVNYTGTVNLTNALGQSGALPENFVFISTVAVYGKDSGELIDESNPLYGKTPYAKSKIQAEEYLIAWCARYGVRLTILRLPLIVGANAPGNLGAMVRFVKRGIYIGIGSGSSRKSMVLAGDVADFIPTVARVGGIYNLTDGYNPTMQELENAIAFRFGKRKPVRMPDVVLKLIAYKGDFLGKLAPFNTPRFKKLTATLTFSDEKAKAIGWKPRPVLTNLPV